MIAPEFPRGREKNGNTALELNNRYFKKDSSFEEPDCISVKETPTYIAMLNNNAVFLKA